MRRAVLAMALAAGLPVAAQDMPRFRQVMGGDPELGRELIADYAAASAMPSRASAAPAAAWALTSRASEAAT